MNNIFANNRAVTVNKIKKHLLNTSSYIGRIMDADNIFLLIATLFIALFVTIIPQSWGLDEQVHIARVYQVADGGLYPDKVGQGEYGGVLPTSLIQVVQNGHSESNQSERNKQIYDPTRIDFKHSEYAHEIESQPLNSSQRAFYNFGTTGPYAPVVYLPAATGMKLAMILNLSVGQALVLSKLTQALFYVICIYIALWIVRAYRVKWLLLVIALLPMNIFLSSTINADSYTTAMILLFSAVMIRLLYVKKQLSRLHYTVLAATTFGVVFTKPSYAIVIALILLLPASKFAKGTKGALLKYGLIAAGICLFLLISLKGLQYSDSMAVYFTAEQMQHIDMKQQLLFIAAHPIDFLKVLVFSSILYGYNWYGGFMGTFGYNTVQLPFLIMVGLTATITIAALYIDKMTKTAAWCFLGVGVISALSVVTLLYLTFNEIGDKTVGGVQGRYFIPSMVLILIGIARVIGAQVVMKEMNARVLFSVVPIISLGAAYVAYYKAIF